MRAGTDEGGITKSLLLKKLELLHDRARVECGYCRGATGDIHTSTSQMARGQWSPRQVRLLQEGSAFPPNPTTPGSEPVPPKQTAGCPAGSGTAAALGAGGRRWQRVGPARGSPWPSLSPPLSSGDRHDGDRSWGGGAPAGEAQKGHQPLGQTQSTADCGTPCRVPSVPSAWGPRRHRGRFVAQIIQSRLGDRPSETAPSVSPERLPSGAFSPTTLSFPRLVPARPAQRRRGEAVTGPCRVGLVPATPEGPTGD